MLIYTVRRLLTAIPVLIAATLFTFFLIDLFGDPLEPLILAQPPVPPETIEARRQALYLDRGHFERYWLWLTGLGNTNGDIGLLQGKWGPSVRPTIDIGDEVGSRFLITARLVLVAIFFATVLAVVSGVVSAVKQYSKIDYALTFFGFVCLAMPTFWLAALLKETGVWLNQQVGSTIFYTFGERSANFDRLSTWDQFGDIAGRLALPTLALMLTGYAAISRFQRASMLEVLNSDYVRLARAKGLRNRVVMRRHALRTALIPVTTLTALQVSAALSGVVIIETIFRWRGLGTFLIDGIRAYDAYAVMGFLVLAGTLVVVANLIADLLYAVLDPRIRYE